MNPSSGIAHRLLKGDLSLIFYMSLFKLMIHLIVNANGGYGLFRDEYYYIACADKLAAGYVDHPPFSIYLLRLMISVFGDSLFAVRLLPAVAGGLTVFFTGLMAMRLGGRQLAVFLACLFSLTPITWAMFGFYSMNSLDILVWTVVAYLIVCIIQNGGKKHWWILGVVLGLGLLNKIGVFFLGAGVFVGFLATKERKWFSTPHPYVAGTIAFLLFLPYIIWNVQNDFAHLEFIRNASSEKYSSLSAISFISGQILINNPIGILIWLPGLIGLFVHKELKRYQLLAYLYVVPLGIFLVNGTSKAEYLAPAYSILWAAGSVWWERVIQQKFYLRYALVIITTLWIIVTAVFIPMVLPVLPVETYIRYANFLNFQPESPEGKEQSELPQFYADMFGWKEKANGVAEVYQSLSEDEKKNCAIFSNNYGRCASVDYYGKDLGLPKTIGEHNNYWIWGPRDYDGRVVIILGGDADGHRQVFEEVTLVKSIDCDYCMPYEDNVPVYLCKGLKVDLKSIWKEEKHFE